MKAVPFVLFTLIFLAVPVLGALLIVHFQGIPIGACRQVDCTALTRLLASIDPASVSIASLGIGVLALVRARSVLLSWVWGAMGLCLTAPLSSLAIQLLVHQLAFPTMDINLLTYVKEALDRPMNLYVLGILLAFFAVVPDTRGIQWLEVALTGLALIAAGATLLIGYRSTQLPTSVVRPLQDAFADVLGAVPGIEWITLGCMLVATIGIVVGRLVGARQTESP
jgi:hypothetical protein